MYNTSSRHQATTAVVFAAGAATLAATDAVIVRALSGAVRPSVLRTTHPMRQHALRAAFKLLAMIALFAAFSWGPLADVTAIAFTSPIFVVLGAALTLGERPGPTLVVWNLLLTVPVALLLAIPFFAIPGPREMGLLALQGVVGTACMGLMTHAFSLAPATVVAPVDFLRLPLVAFGGFALFGETVALTTIGGGALICCAALIAARSGKFGSDNTSN